MTRARRGLLTRWELGLAAVIVLALGAVATQEIRTLRLRTARAEVGMVLTAMRMHLDDVETPRPFGPVPRDPSRVGRSLVAWTGTPLVGFEPPVPSVRGAYRLRGGEPMVLEGWIDADGDGHAAHYELPLERGALRRLTPDAVY